MLYAHVHNNKIEIIETRHDEPTLRRLRQQAFQPIKGELQQVTNDDIPHLVATHTIPTPDGYKFDGTDSFTPMTMDEKLDKGQITADEYNAQVIADRQQEYRDTDGLYMEIIYDAMKAGKEPDLTPWIDAVSDVKQRHVKTDKKVSKKPKK